MRSVDLPLAVWSWPPSSSPPAATPGSIGTDRRQTVRHYL